MPSARRVASARRTGQYRRTDTAENKSRRLFSLRNNPYFLSVALFLATFAAYSGVGQASFVNFDDDPYVAHNPNVRAGLTWHTIAWAFTSTDESNWHPLTWISHAADCALFGLDPAAHHYSNLLLHEVNVILLFFMLRRSTSAMWRSLIVAALFALHPINVESVAWVAERKNLLSMFFFLLTLAAYGWYTLKPQLSRYLVVVLLFACGLMSKPQVVTLPFVLLLLDYWPLRRGIFVASEPTKSKAAAAKAMSFAALIREKLPLFLLSAASSYVTFEIQRVSGAMTSGARLRFGIRFENAIVSYARYLGKAFWPFGLAPLYPHPGNTLHIWMVLLAVLLLAAITALVIAFRQQRYLAVGWFWFLGILVPMLGLVQVGEQAMADRYAYIPFIGLFVMVCWGVGEWIRRRNLPARWVAVPVVATLLALGVITNRQVGFWKDSVALWSHTVSVTGPNLDAQDDLGEALVVLGRIDEAMPHFQIAVQMDPLDPRGQMNLAYYAHQQERWQEAAEHYRIVAMVAPSVAMRVNALENLGFVYGKLGDDGHAKQSYEGALQLSPNDAEAMIDLGILAQENGDYAESVRQYTRATVAKPSDVGFLLLSGALEKAGRVADSQAAYQQAKMLSADFERAQQTVKSKLRP